MPWRQRPTNDNLDNSPDERSHAAGIDPEIAALRRSRLERRITNLEHDIQRARSAGQADSRWKQRIDDISNAITQAEREAKHIATPETDHQEIPMPVIPVSHIEVDTNIPATVRFQIGNEKFRYSEEVDWTERGEQRALPGLRRFEGNPDRLAPGGVPGDRIEALQEHLRHAIGALAIALRDEPNPTEFSATLADLARPCPICGNWRDLRDRCIACQRRQWEAGEIRSEITRLIEDRNTLLDEIAKQGEALPILQRQLQDAKRELAKYQES